MGATIVSRDEAVSLREQYRADGKTVGYTSGVFDLLHAGHVEYLESASRLVDVLIVGVNTDSSVKTNKGDSRPINSDVQRVEVVAGLRSVHHAFLFSERNNNVNIELLKPDLYIKAGDYSNDKLTSKHIVESYGGRVQIIPLREGLSTTSIIEKISLAAISEEGPGILHTRAPAVFVDRDGTINEHVEYLSDPKKFIEIPNSFKALKRLLDAGFRIVVVTNQAGIGLGYFSKEEFFRVNREMMRQASAVGGHIHKIYFCPHTKAEQCVCRKPEPFFIHRAAEELNIDVSRSFAIGDMTSDVQLGKNGGCRSILVQTGQAGRDGLFSVTPDFVAKDLADAAEWILAQPHDAPLTDSPRTDEPPALGRPGEPAHLEAATTEGGKLVSSVSADFNNIFGSILGCASLIAQKTGVERGVSGVDEVVTILKKAANRGLAISKKMNTLLWAGEAPKGRRSVRACVESVVELLSSTHGDECQIEVVCARDLEVEMADFVVVQMLLELCENSLLAMRNLPERFIMFHVEAIEVKEKAKALDIEPGLYARVSLVDHGDGISEERREVVFEPFSADERDGRGEGIGLSLSMAKAIMKTHGGTITLASQRSVGTNVSLYFPAARSAV